jgi:tetratricopeptide (TPR) repeat protein
MAVKQYNIANVFCNQKEYDEALNLYSESETVLKILGDNLNLMNVYYDLAICHTNMNQKEKSAQYYQKAERLKKQLEISWSRFHYRLEF